MSTKNNPGPYNCYAKAEPDEPMFVLLGRDPAASILIALWSAAAAVIRVRDKKEHVICWVAVREIPGIAISCQSERRFAAENPER